MIPVREPATYVVLVCEQPDVAEVPGQSDEVLHSEGVDLQCFVERRVEVDHTGRIDDYVDGPTNLITQIDREAAERLHDVAGDGHYLLAHELLELIAVLSA